MIGPVVALGRRIRRAVGTAWFRLGLRLFPRATDTAITKDDGLVIRHFLEGRSIELYRGTEYGPALAQWARLSSPANPGRHSGELQFWKNGKLRATRAAI